MLSTILHPEYLFLKKEDLQTDLVKRFVDNLLRVKKVIEDVDEAKVVFSKNLWLKISTDAPWSKIHENNFPKQYTISINAIIFPFLTNNDNVTTISDEEISELLPCNSNPELTFFENQILDETKKIISYVKAKSGNFFLINQKGAYQFFYEGEKLDVNIINSPEELYEKVSYEELWPKNKNDSNGFEKCLKFYRKIKGKKAIASYCVKRKFLSDILDETKKNKIIDRLGGRLSMTLTEAESILGDHEVSNPNTRRKERRFHVDRGSTVHYIYNKKNEISFERFYPASKHNEGYR